MMLVICLVKQRILTGQCRGAEDCISINMGGEVLHELHDNL